MIDGVALAASAVADAQHAGISMAGLGTFLAIALHKPLDAFAITSTMRSSGWSPTHQGIINVVFAIACPVGALLFYFGVTQLSDSSMVLGWGLAISAGFFICIALADLLPEVSFHQHDRGKLTLSLILGIALAFVVENLPGHSHIHSNRQSRPQVVEADANRSDDRIELEGVIELEVRSPAPDPSGSLERPILIDAASR
jgi:zinc and cadmium transporter